MLSEEAGRLLRQMYDTAPRGDRLLQFHLFGIRYADQIEGLSNHAIIVKAGLPVSYETEIAKGRKLAKYVGTLKMSDAPTGQAESNRSIRESFESKEFRQMMVDFHGQSELDLLRLYSDILTELQKRGVCRTDNNPVGDYTEWLVCQKLSFELQPNSKAGFDCFGPDNLRYQIKGRRSNAKRVQFSAIRNLDQGNFDFVIAVAFRTDWSLRFGLKLSRDAIRGITDYQGHTNSHRLMLSGREVGLDGVEDIRSLLTD